MLHIRRKAGFSVLLEDVYGFMANDPGSSEVLFPSTSLFFVGKRFERRLKQVRHNLEDLAHDLLAAKKTEELETHRFALGHGAAEKKIERSPDEEGFSAVAGNKQQVAEAGKGRSIVYRGPEVDNVAMLAAGTAVAATMPPTGDDDAERAVGGDGAIDDEEKGKRETPGEDEIASAAAADTDAVGRPIGEEKKTAPAPADTGDSDAGSPPGGDPAVGGPPVASPSEEEKGEGKDTTQTPGEAATEEANGGSRDEGFRTTKRESSSMATEQQELSSTQAKEQSSSSLSSSSPPPPNLPETADSDKGILAVDAVEALSVQKRPWQLSKTLPDSLAREIGDRAFPLALAAGKEGGDKGEGKEENGDGEEGAVEEGGASSRGVTCAAFHALAAEAVWAGFNGSNCVEKPPDNVWDPRGGDRWGTAAFFAEKIGEREDEAVQGLPRHSKMLIPQVDNISSGGTGGGGRGDGRGGRCLGQHPVSDSSASHAAARAVCMAAVSSRRGFLKQAAEEAAKEVCIESSIRLLNIFSCGIEQSICCSHQEAPEK